MDTIGLTINEKRIEVPPKSTILQAALRNGIYIPHLCWDRRLTPYGGCRLCVVEVEGVPKLLAACSTPVTKDMVVRTETEKLAKARKTVLELLLIHHPLDCPICDKAGECELQDLAFKYGPSESRFSGKRKAAPEVLSAPLIDRNPNRCILCGKCVRVCVEHQGVGAINLIGRGFESKVSPAFEETLDCEFCGQCIDSCPVGALGSKPYRFRSRVWLMDERENICPYCGCGCTVTMGVRDGKIVRSVGKDGVGMSEGDLCGRGRFGLDFVSSEMRLKAPLIRKDGELVPATWEEALSYTAKRLGEIAAANGPGAIGAIGSARGSLEDNYMLQKFMREAVGTNNIDSISRFGYLKAQDGIKRAFGLDTMPIRLNSPDTADAILVLESDITSTHPIFGLKFLRAARERGAKLIVADPKSTKLTRWSTQWLRIKPGTSVALANGMMKVVLDEGLASGDAQRIPGYEALRKSLEEYTLERTAEITGVSPDDIAQAARAFAKGTKRLLGLTMGSAENTKGTNLVLASANLLMLLGSGPESLQVPAEFANTLGVIEAGVRPDFGPGHSPVAAKGLDVRGMLYDSASPIKAMYIMAENPVITFPESGVVESALKNLDFLVVQDIMLSDTAKLAHVVLPAASWSEKEGTLVGSAGVPQRAVKCLAETGLSVPDWTVLRNLARTMQKPLGAETIEALREEIKAKVNFDFQAAPSSLSFNPVVHEEAEAVDGEYPFVMVTGILMQHSGSLTAVSKALGSVVSDAYLQMNDVDAKRLNIKDEGFVRVNSRRGEAYLKARVTDEVREGMLFAPAHFPHARVNALTMPATNGVHSAIAVKVEPVV